MTGPRRIVTGINEQGRSYVAQDGPTPGHIDFKAFTIDELWKVDAVPVTLHEDGDPADVDRFVLEPPADGVKCCFFTLRPDAVAAEMTDADWAFIQEHYIGLEAHDDPGDPAWHVTDSLDFVVVLRGEMDLELDEELVHLRPGDVVIQRGTRHAWRNTGTEPCTVMAVLLSARPSEQRAEI